MGSIGDIDDDAIEWCLAADDGELEAVVLQEYMAAVKRSSAGLSSNTAKVKRVTEETIGDVTQATRTKILKSKGGFSHISDRERILKLDEVALPLSRKCIQRGRYAKVTLVLREFEYARKKCHDEQGLSGEPGRRPNRVRKTGSERLEEQPSLTAEAVNDLRDATFPIRPRVEAILAQVRQCVPSEVKEIAIGVSEIYYEATGNVLGTVYPAQSSDARVAGERKKRNGLGPVAGDLLTVSEVAELIRRNPSGIRSHCERGTLRAIKKGKTWLIARSDISPFLEAYPDESKPGPKRP